MRVAFQPVDQVIIEDLLTRERKLSAPQSDLAARVAAGSVTRARSFDPADYERRRQPWLDFLEAMARRGGPASPVDWRLVFDSARALAENRDDFEGTLNVGYSLLSDLMHILLNPDAGAVMNIDVAARLKAWAPVLTLSGIEKLKAGIDQAYRLQIRNVNPQLGFETLGIEVASDLGPASR